MCEEKAARAPHVASLLRHQQHEWAADNPVTPVSSLCAAKGAARCSGSTTSPGVDCGLTRGVHTAPCVTVGSDNAGTTQGGCTARAGAGSSRPAPGTSVPQLHLRDISELGNHFLKSEGRLESGTEPCLSTPMWGSVGWRGFPLTLSSSLPSPVLSLRTVSHSFGPPSCSCQRCAARAPFQTRTNWTVQGDASLQMLLFLYLWQRAVL